MLVDLYKTYNAPLNSQRLFLWHEMLTNGRRDLQDMGRYRISEKALSQGLERPTLIALAQAIERSRKAYYAALQIGNRGLDCSISL
jgi:hypothetical protein